ncbi:hypothetical protein DdX_19077 [Ditylenchus destructor]|uniref:Serpentine receptor class gamma n=1 Tax=Ditylenchus destructor TaxID=166010 RepID=A0AAD4QSG5_9BILA|nr:hypothetical protein DdX_19077 [Ditylenchus destructor]
MDYHDASSALEIAGTMFNGTMIYFLFRQIRRRREEFTGSGFYTIFPWTSVYNFVSVFLDNVTAKFNDYGWFPDLYIYNHVVGRIAILGGSFIFYYQTWANFFLATNRFIVIVLPKRDMVIYALFPIASKYESVPTCLGDYLPSSHRLLLVTIHTPVGIVHLFITLILEIATLICIKRYLRNAATISKARISEIQLVFFSLYTFFVYLSLMLSNFWAMFAAQAGNKQVVSSIIVFNYWMYETQVLAPPVAMFIISSFVRNEYLRFYGLRKSNTATPVVSMNTTSDTNQLRYNYSFVRNEYLRFYGLRKSITATPVVSMNTTGSTNQLIT